MQQQTRLREVVEEARSLTTSKDPAEIGRLLHAHGWKFLGKGAYKAAFIKARVVVKVLSLEVTRAEACSLDHKGGGYSEFFPHGGYEIGDPVEFYSGFVSPHTLTKNECIDWLNGYRKLPASVRKYMSHPFFAQGLVLCQLEAPRAKREDCTCRGTHFFDSRVEKAVERISSAGGPFIGDASFGHNHGHLPDGTPVFYDGL